MSPSVWRVWIEILAEFVEKPYNVKSPSVWRVWIEICYHFKVLRSFYGHPPCGGCGLKYLSDVYPDRSLDHSLYGKRG